MGLIKGVRPAPYKAVIYGKGGIGKSTVAAQAPGALVLDIDGDVDRIDGVKTDRVRAWSDLYTPPGATEPGILNRIAIDGAYEGFKPTTVVFDTLSGLEKILTPVCIADWNNNNTAQVTSLALSDIPYGNGPKIIAAYFSLVMDIADALRDKHNISTLLVAHQTTDKFKNPMGEDYDRYTFLLPKQAREIVFNRADAVLFAMVESHVVEKDGKGFNKGDKRAVTTGKRILRTIGKAEYDAKNRFSLGETIPMDTQLFEVMK